MTRQYTVDDWIATLPYQLGYELDDHVVLVGVGEDNRLKMNAAIKWDADTDPTTLANYTAGHCTDPMERAGSHYIVALGYGPNGAERAETLARAVEHASDSLTVNRIGQVHDGQYHFTLPNKTSPRELPPPPAEVIIDGHMAPAASPEAMQQEYAPLDEPTYAPPDASTARRLNSLKPSLRADIATRNLDALTRPETTNEQRSELQSVLAHIADTDALARDAVLIDSMDSPAKSEALTAAFRGAPEEYRSRLAGLAGMSTYITQQSTLRAHAILTHGKGKDKLADLGLVMTHNQMPPTTVRSAFNRTALTRDEMDTRDQAAQAQHQRGAAFPNSPSPQQTLAGAGAAHYRPPGHEHGPTPER